MSTDPLPPEPPDTEAPAGITQQPEPFVAEPAERDIAVVEPARPADEEPPRRRRRLPPERPLPAAPPQPGFWWAVLACVLMVFVSQLIVPLCYTVVALIVQSVRLASFEDALKGLQADLSGSAEFMLPVLALSQATIFVMALLGLRLLAGKSWPRQVGLGLPSAVHVLLAVLGVPGFWLLSAGFQLVASHVLPSFGALPSYFVAAVLVTLLVGAYWLAVRVTTGRDWVPELAAAPLRTQVVLGPLGVFLGLVLAVQLFQMVSPYVFRIDLLDDPKLLEKFVESLQHAPWWAAVLVVGGCPAFGEEFWCRAFLGRGLVGRHGFVMGIIWTSLFFGAIHLLPHQAAMAALIGMVLHSAYVASRSLLIPMLMHFLNNSLAVVGDKAPGWLGERLKFVETDPERIPGVWFAAAALLAAAVLWAFYTSRARLVRVDGADEPPWQPPFPGVAHPPEGSGTAVVCPWPGVLPTLAVIVAFAALVGALRFFP
jgi:membrane protease YdiL (CAAX protease family)